MIGIIVFVNKLTKLICESFQFCLLDGLNGMNESLVFVFSSDF